MSDQWYYSRQGQQMWPSHTRTTETTCASGQVQPPICLETGDGWMGSGKRDQGTAIGDHGPPNHTGSIGFTTAARSSRSTLNASFGHPPHVLLRESKRRSRQFCRQRQSSSPNRWQAGRTREASRMTLPSATRRWAKMFTAVVVSATTLAISSRNWMDFSARSSRSSKPTRHPTNLRNLPTVPSCCWSCCGSGEGEGGGDGIQWRLARTRQAGLRKARGKCWCGEFDSADCAALAHLETLDREIKALSESHAGGFLTPKRLLIGGVAAIVIVVLAAVTQTSTQHSKSADSQVNGTLAFRGVSFVYSGDTKETEADAQNFARQLDNVDGGKSLFQYSNIVKGVKYELSGNKLRVSIAVSPETRDEPAQAILLVCADAFRRTTFRRKPQTLTLALCDVQYKETKYTQDFPVDSGETAAEPQPTMAVGVENEKQWHNQDVQSEEVDVREPNG